MKRVFICSLVMVFGFFAPGLNSRAQDRTRAQVDQEVVRTYASFYLEQKDDLRAEDVIQQYLYLSTERGEGDLWLELGEIQMNLSKFPEACHSLQKAIDGGLKGEERQRALYHFAHSLNRNGRFEDSKKVLGVLAAEEGPGQQSGARVLKLMTGGYLKAREAFPPYSERVRGLWRVAGAVGSGFDSNVLLLADSIASGTPVSGRGSAFIAPAFQVGRVGRWWGDTFDSRLMSVFTDYLNPDTASFNSSYTRADFQYGSGSVRWSAFSDAFFLNRSPFQLYSYTGGISWSLRKLLPSGKGSVLEVPLQFQRFLLDSGDNDRTGEDLKVKYSRRWVGEGNRLLSLGMVGDLQYSQGKNYRLIGLGLPAFLMTDLPLLHTLGVQNTFTAEIWGQYYAQSDVSRRDLLLKAGAGLSRTVGDSWMVSLDYVAQQNLSSFDSARYSKDLVTVQVSHPFL